MRELIHPALAAEMQNAQSSAARLRAAEDVLDRAGLGRGSKIETKMTAVEAKEYLKERMLEIREQNLREVVDPPDAVT